MNSEGKPIKTIIFDWAGVFCVPGEPFSHPDLLAQTGKSVDELGAETQSLQGAYYRGAMTPDEFWNAVIDRYNLSGLTPSDLGSAYLSSYEIYPEMLTTVGALRPSYHTVLLSNLTDEMMRDILDRHHIADYFDHLAFSNQIGVSKPDSESFLKALQLADTSPEEALFIDDSSKNVRAAEALGIRAFQFESGIAQDLLDRLRVFGVKN